MTTTDDSIVFCPACGARYTVIAELLEGSGLRVLCGTCGGGFSADEVTATTDAAAQSAAKEAIDTLHFPRVVIGHEVPSATRTIARVLRAGGYAPVPVVTGEQVLQACDPALPERAVAVVLDVGVPGVMAFEVIEQIRAHPAMKEMPVVLLASVFERTRYKRRPNRLYGADTYLELHHVPDRLVMILDALREKRPVPSERVQAPADRARAAALHAEVSTLDEEGLRRLARRVLSDMALYHGDEVSRGVAEGKPLAHLPDAVDAARELFREIAGDESGLFEQELNDFIARLNERDFVRQKANG